MARSETYQSLQQAIADELGDRQDLLAPLSDSGLSLSPIQSAIQSAISFWEREPFWFNEGYSNILLAPLNAPFFIAMPLQEFYGPLTSPTALDLSTYPRISTLSVLVNQNRYIINPRTWQYIEEISVNPSVHSEFPIDYAVSAGLLRLYPIPAEAVPINATFNHYLAPLVNPMDSNAWTTIAYDLIRSQAKLILAQEVLYDDDLAARTQQQAERYLYNVRAETTRRTGHARIRPSHF